jgi:hypothetical protein
MTSGPDRLETAMNAESFGALRPLPPAPSSEAAATGLAMMVSSADITADMGSGHRQSNTLNVRTFDRTLERDSTRLLIRSKCALCGECRTVSEYDGSLNEWESSHCCEAVCE